MRRELLAILGVTVHATNKCALSCTSWHVPHATEGSSTRAPAQCHCVSRLGGLGRAVWVWPSGPSACGFRQSALSAALGAAPDAGPIRYLHVEMASALPFSGGTYYLKNKITKSSRAMKFHPSGFDLSLTWRRTERAEVGAEVRTGGVEGSRWYGLLAEASAQRGDGQIAGGDADEDGEAPQHALGARGAPRRVAPTAAKLLLPLPPHWRCSPKRAPIQGSFYHHLLKPTPATSPRPLDTCAPWASSLAASWLEGTRTRKRTQALLGGCRGYPRRLESAAGDPATCSHDITNSVGEVAFIQQDIWRSLM